MVIPALAALVIHRFKRDAPEGEVEPKHPAVRFILAAWNDRDFGDSEEVVAPGLTIHVNGFTFEPVVGFDGPEMARQAIDYWRTVMPDVRMKLLDEIGHKDHIAFRWALTGTHTGEIAGLPATGNTVDLRGAAFLTLKDDRIVRAASYFDGLSLAVQTGAAEPPSWWPWRGTSSAS